MATSSVVLMILWLLVGLVGVAAFFLQAVRHWRSRTPISSKNNLLLRLLWLLPLAILGMALLVSEGLDLENVLCGGLIWMGILILVLTSGYLIEHECCRVIGRSKKQ